MLHRIPGPTLARKLLAATLVLSVVVTVVGAAGAFAVIRSSSEREKIFDLSQYAEHRAKSQQDLFAAIGDDERAATHALELRLHALDGVDVDRQFDAWFPLQADGTRRSAPGLFDGMADGAGDLLYGVGGFLSHGADLSRDDKRLLLAATQVVGDIGEARRGRVDSFYFVTPETRLVVFGPDRADKLSYYRRTARPGFTVGDAEMVQITLPAHNLEGATRCTRLQRVLSDPTRRSTACMTPVYLDGRYVGAWGATLRIDDYLTKAVRDAPEGSTNLIVSDAGDLIAYPGFTKPGAVSREAEARYARAWRLKELIASIKARGRPFGVIDSPDGDNLVAYGALGGPRWWFVITTPKAAIAHSAAASALSVLWFGLGAVAVETLLLFLMVRRMVVKPLERLARHSAAAAEGPAHGDAEVADLSARVDEIGTLARALAHERARFDDLLRSLEARVQERTAELENANKAKSLFLANMSHELRTPLNGVIALSEALEQRQSDAEAREMAALIVSSGRLLEQVLTDILDVSKIEAGQMRLEAAPFDLEPLVSRIAELHRASAEAKGLKLSWRVASDTRGRYEGDPVRLTQILSNLLSNAVKFTAAGSVRLEVDRAGYGALRFAVVDTGVGFDEEVKSRLFRRFEQADASTTRRFGGSGLGLAICASLADLMGGRVSAHGDPGRGARFEVELPLPPARTETIAGVARDDVAAQGLSGVRVLLAEDHPTNQRIVQLVLEPTGAELTVVADGAAAIDAWADGGFDVVLMDMQMPVMDGLSALREIRRREAIGGSPRTPVIMLTANALAEHVSAALEAGADLHVAKPLRADGLIRAVAGCLDARAAAA